ncbi:MAG: DNA primase small subunit domain-containing protein [Candidatus Pacearchaeota archaeon]
MKKESIKEISKIYYSRKEIQKAIKDFCKNRETITKYQENFGKRPNIIEYEDEILQEVKKGATSFHCSEELWKNPLDLSKNLDRKEMDELRIGWDLILDIDSKYFEYSKIMTKLIIKTLEFHDIKNYGIKFSGSKGFHIIIPWKAFPEKINNIEIRKMFPEFPRTIISYLHKFVEKELIKEISRITTKKDYIRDEQEAKRVIPDLVLVSSRHLFRTPYSLHEKTGLVSVVIEKKELDSFEPKDAHYLKIKVKNFYPEARKNEAKELLIQALDWKESIKKEEKIYTKNFEKIEIDKSTIYYPPCIKKILEGLDDGRKRALFILINYYRSLNFTKEEILKKVEEWNLKNKKPLKENYLLQQIKYNFLHKGILPPNCDKSYYKDIDICYSDDFCKKIKNPINYTILKNKIMKKK